MQAQLRETLDAHLQSLSQQYEQAIADARRAAMDDAERAVEARLQAVELEWGGRLEAEVAGARAEAQRQLVAELTRVRVEAEQQAAESAARVRQELEEALATERQRAEALVQAERQRAAAEIENVRAEARQAADRAAQAERAREADAERIRAAEAERARLQAELEKAEEARAKADADRQQTAATHARDFQQAKDAHARELQQARDQQQAHADDQTVERLVAGVRAIDTSRSLSDALKALLQHASSIAPRAIVFLVNGDRLKSWKAVGFPQFDAHPFESAISGTGLLAQAIQTGNPVVASGSQPAPTFASITGDGSALAAPIVVGGRAVAVVYADHGPDAKAPGAWRASVEALVRHASTQLALLTAMRTVQAVGAAAPVPTGTGGAVAPDADVQVQEQGARRYARLLVSEIKLYNEAAVRTGREHRDLLRRLGPEIERARRMYEERVSPRLPSRGAYFQQELVQTLADGDPGLLGKG